MDIKKEDSYVDGPEKKTGWCCGSHSHAFWFVKLAGLVLILVIIFGVCAAFIRHGERRDFGRYSRRNDINGNFAMMADRGDDYGCPMGRNWNDRLATDDFGMMKGNAAGFRTLSGTQIFGNITKVEGGKITIQDNGAQEKIVTSSSTTRIIGATGAINLSSLKPGMNITAVGTQDKDGNLQAVIIKVE